MRLHRFGAVHCTVLLTVISLAQAQSVPSPVANSPNFVQKTLSFPSPVQWELNANNSDADISLTEVAWGSQDAPEMIAKATELEPNQKPEQFIDRHYVIALGFQARLPRPLLNMWTRSGLALIKDTAGNMELPWQLTASGFLRHDYDLHFVPGGSTTQYWDFFPVSTDQKEFLFEVHAPAQNTLYFRVILKDSDLIVVNSTPEPASACLQFERVFGGTIGAKSVVTVQIKRDNHGLSGTEKYTRIGKTLWLRGAVDSLGYFIVEERYPKDTVTGILKGRFDSDYRNMSGYFSKPDGSRLQPFEFHVARRVATPTQTSPQPNCESEESPAH